MNLIFFVPKKGDLRVHGWAWLGNLPVPSICIVPAGQNVFLEGGFHETSVLSDHSLDVPTAWRETWDLALKTGTEDIPMPHMPQCFCHALSGFVC